MPDFCRNCLHRPANAHDVSLVNHADPASAACRKHGHTLEIPIINAVKVISWLRRVSNVAVLVGTILLILLLLGVIPFDSFEIADISGLRAISTWTISSCLVSAILYGLTDWNLIQNKEEQ